MIQDFLMPFFAISIAELGDKTQLSILLLSSKTREHFKLLLGVMLAFLVVDGVAVAAGSWAVNLVPAEVLKILSGLVFIFFGVLAFLSKESDHFEKLSSGNPLVSGFTVILLAEWGDKTQVASGLFATRYSPFFVLAGALTALAILSILAVYLGKAISGRIDKKVMATAAGIVFMAMGASFILL